MRDSIGQERWPLPNPFLGTASSSVLTCSNNTRKQPAGDYFGERRNLSGVSLSRLRVRKTCRHVLVCTLTDACASTVRVPMSNAAAFQQRADLKVLFLTLRSQCYSLSGLHCIFFFTPHGFFFPLYTSTGMWVHPVSVCVCVVQGLGRNFAE